MKKINYIILAFVFAVGACNSSKKVAVQKFAQEGALIDRSGLDGCGWMIKVLSNQEKEEWLTPLNLNEFKVEIKEGQKIQFNYVEEKQVNTCMAGPIIRITELKQVD